MTSLLLRNCRLVVVNAGESEVPDASIAVQDNLIASVGVEPPDGAYDRIIDCSDLVAMPGLVNTHHHLYQTLTRGFPQSRGQKLFDWLVSLYPIWAGLDEDMIRASAMTGLAELLLSGCTTSADHLYVFPPGSDRFIDAEIDAARELGIRFHPTRGSMDLGQSNGGLPPDSVVQPVDTILADCERVLHRYHDTTPGAMVRVGLAPCSPFSVSVPLMEQSASLAREHGARLHTHIAETKDEDAFSREHYGVSPIALLDRHGWLGSDVWLAHCVHPSNEDVALMAHAQVGVAHCPTSNMLLGSGLAPIRSFLDARLAVGLGVDGSASNDGNDLRNETKQALLSARVRDGVECMTVREALRLATVHGAHCLGRSDLGMLEAGKVADIILFDAAGLETAGGEQDLVATIVLGSTRPSLVLVNGRLLVEGGRLAHADERAIAAEHNRQSRRLLARAA